MLITFIFLIQFYILITNSQLSTYSDLFNEDIIGLSYNNKSKSLTKDQVLAQVTYDKVTPCLLSAWMLEFSLQTFTYPIDAQEHYESILNKTEIFRHVEVHEYAEYKGPWIENIFIQKFIDKPLSYFNGFIPLFIQWIDSQILKGRHFDHIQYVLSKVLRPDVIYLAVSQGDVGLGKIGTAFPNILVLSAGGYGHIPIPLIKAQIDFEPFLINFETEIGFYGNQNPYLWSRHEMLKIINDNAVRCNISVKFGPSWERDMALTKFNLAPRGYGRSSFRFAESIQMGRVPIFLYDDIPWVPYQGTNLSIETFGFLRGLSNKVNLLSDLPCELKQITDQEYRRLLFKILSVRDHFTYSGVINQIAMFIQDPFGVNGGNLRCINHPRTERCCDN